MTGELVSLGTAFFWAMTVTLFEYAGKSLGSLVVNTLRLFYGLFFIGFILLITQGYFMASTSIEGWTYLLFSGLLGFIIGDFFLFQAFIDIGGRLSLLLYSTTPIFGAIIDYLVFGETLELFSIIGISMTLLGIGFAVHSRSQGKIKNKHLLRGSIFAVIGAMGQASGLIFSKLGLSEGLSAFEVTQMRILVGLVGFLIILMIRGKLHAIPKSYHHKKASIAMVFGSITGPVLGIWSSIYAMQFAPIGITTTIAQLNTILIIPISMIFFKERIHLKEMIAALIAFSGVALLFLF